MTSLRVGWLSELSAIQRTIPVTPFAIYQQSSDVIEPVFFLFVLNITIASLSYEICIK